VKKLLWCLTIEAVPGWSVPPDRRLAKAMKGLLRAYGLKVVRVERASGEVRVANGAALEERRIKIGTAHP
jgi:hypothetical protein